jgi:hypothetical protein
MNRKRLLIPVIVALSLPLMGCFQCAAGADITQTQTITLSQDLTCMVIGLGFFAIVFGLMFMAGLGGGFGGGQ